MITITRGGYAATTAARCAAHVTALNAAQLQGTGLPIVGATSTDSFGPVWRLRGKRATAEHDSAPPV
ncbi:hypothetical protein AFE02nite_23930 [Actinotalea fermentans]|uniref:Uncharacterized protein n=1 Tax=Actinotalea fermentans TaxID=43671 RepID=A0A511YZQ1_9CELL|nr:hypothetical protein AFE02nite_23930 [Actinotalea fermentans]